jgi:uncharacterized protein
MLKIKATTSEAIEIVKKYIKELEQSGFHIKTAILFGSYATGKFNEWSDIDVALVSDNFEGNRFDDKDKIRKITLSVDSDISPLPYKSEDFTEDDLFVKEILETGIKIV